LWEQGVQFVPFKKRIVDAKTGVMSAMDTNDNETIQTEETIDISQYIQPDLIATNIGALTKEEAITRLVEKAFTHERVRNQNISQETVLQEVLKREGIQSTGIGKHIAFPHARIPGWKDFVVIVGTSKEGIVFDSMDGKRDHQQQE